VGARFILFVPTGASTKGDEVEGRGVPPDVVVPSERALESAHRLALRRIVPAITDSTRRKQFEKIQRDVDADAAGRTATQGG
jgi:C-terminal processing protease CtpA/Prc